MRRAVSKVIPALLVLAAVLGPAPLLAAECTPQKPSCCCPGGCGGGDRSDRDTLERPCCGNADGVPVPEPAAVENPTASPAPTMPVEVAAAFFRPASPRRLDSAREIPGTPSPPVPLFTLHASLLI